MPVEITGAGDHFGIHDDAILSSRGLHAYTGTGPNVIVPHAHHHRWATSFDIDCDFDAMAKNGEEFRYWWPGKAGKGECNDLTDDERGCWYPGTLVKKDDPNYKCNEDNPNKENERCLQVQAQDNEQTHMMTCPSWIRKVNEKDQSVHGERCKIPSSSVFSASWQACPLKFALRRQINPKVAALKGFYWRAFKAFLTECHGKDKDCLEHEPSRDSFNEKELEHISYYLDLRTNEWYKCTPWLKCQKIQITEIDNADETDSVCHSKGKLCKEGDQCMNIIDPILGTDYHCVPSWKVNVLSRSMSALSVASAMGIPKVPGSMSDKQATRRQCHSAVVHAHCLGQFL